MRRRTKVLMITAIMLLLAGGALAGTWVWAAGAVQDGYETWRAERRAEGYSFQNADPEVDGFPTTVRARLRQPVVAAPQGGRWEGPVVVGETGVLSPFTVRVRAPGTHSLRTVDGRELRADAQTAHGRVLLKPAGGLRSGQITLEQVALDGLPAGPMHAAALFVALGPERRPADAPPALDFTLETDGLALPARLDTAFGRQVDRLAVRGTLIGQAPRQLTRGALQAWRQRGGRIAVDHLELTWTPVRLRGHGTLTLDNRLRPQGTLDVAVTGLGPALDQLAAAGRIERSAVTYAKLAIAALGRRDPATGETTVDVPLSFREGRVYLGPVPLGRLTPVLPASTG
ncbi:hypothetical protein CKO28_15440 [Rhodovibrio sodomensis]|uniref:DUF2125 domain-containing protein n=1 Tax=Rhodovibrio sodomensis TaxID=1088 RepID=A0ABS1DHF9_9PROT|nr:DUF2125 domain-containing protein [Rhodovibrio sodomensis]MBK1669431.1 hypothetical protein [Rhodovibrio sodomensis]